MSTINVMHITVTTLVVSMHISNVLSITRRRDLHKASYFILINLSMSDLIMAITRVIIDVCLFRKEYVYIISDISYYSSIVSTVLISVDRYIAIQYCLRYGQIVTKQSLGISIIISWCASIFLKLIHIVEKAKLKKLDSYFKVIDDITRYVCIFGSCIALVCLSLRMLRTRRKHIKLILGRKTHFGVEQEKLDKLRELKQSIKNVFRLNLATAVIVVTANICKICAIYTTSNAAYLLTVLFNVIYFVSNPFLYALTMSELREHYCATFRYVFSKLSRRCFVRSTVIAMDTPANNVTVV